MNICILRWREAELVRLRFGTAMAIFKLRLKLNFKFPILNFKTIFKFLITHIISNILAFYKGRHRIKSLAVDFRWAKSFKTG